MAKELLKLLRPHQWIKNGIVLSGLIFSGSADRADNFITVLIATGLFCLISSTVYIINDIADAEADRAHPKKSNRPIASGKISVPVAIIAAIILGGGTLTISHMMHWGFFLTITGYFVLNLCYSFVLKHIVIIDVMSIATGFVLRAFAGAVIIGVTFSGWLLITSFLMALVLGLGKRRHELVTMENSGQDHRRILKKYSSYFLDQLIGIVTPAVLVCYLLYAISPDVQERLGTEYFYLTAPFVFYGIFRYIYLIHREQKGGSPTRILITDKPILATVLLWLLSSVLLIYYF